MRTLEYFFEHCLHIYVHIRDRQWISFSLLISTHDYKCASNIDWFIHSYSLQRWFTYKQHKGCYEDEHNVEIKLKPFEISLSHDSNNSSKFTVLVIVAFTKNENKHISKKDKAANKANTQPFCEYFSARTESYLFCAS